ncbi:MAG: DUF86 domain-containing protein [Myxococcales bacterium]|nr:DUF86 domain-containing protein [Myxococcales bacterium]MCB9583445.1 DUF86 domain-containing protein [Polyangiaceae bacterium]
MVNRDLLAAKLAELAERVERAQKHCPESVEELSKDADALDLVSFNLMLAVQTCADVASHIIADEGWPVARTLAEGFHRLRDHGVLTPETAEALCRAVGLRNVVVHGYAGVNPTMVHSAATQGLNDLRAFAREVARFAQA